MKTVKAMGLVLRTRKFGEADHLLSLFTPELGKVAAIAKGARKAKGSMRGKTQPFVYGNYLLYKGKSLYTVTQAEMIFPFNKIGQDVMKYGYASYVCELLDAILENDHPLPELFALLLGVMHSINLAPHPLIIVWFQLHLLKILGYEPQLKFCVNCGKAVKEGPVHLSSAQGGVLCQHCSPRQPNFSGGARAAMAYLLQAQLQKLWRIKLTTAILHEVESLAEEIISLYLTQPIKSREFLRCIKKD